MLVYFGTFVDLQQVYVVFVNLQFFVCCMGWNKIEIYNVYMLGCILGEGIGVGTGGICPLAMLSPPPHGSLSCLVSLFWHPGLCPDFVKPQRTLPPLGKIYKCSTDIRIIYMHEVNIGYHGLSLTLFSFLLWKDPQNCIKYVCTLVQSAACALNFTLTLASDVCET